jgi:ADP-glucose pyrophosphorylase
MENYINKDYYLPLLKEFCNKTMSMYDRGYDQGPFIPYTMSNYGKAPLKIMYVGRDTYYWESVETLKKAYQDNRLEDYLEANMKCVNVDKMLMWKNNSGSFWNFVNKLHLLIRTNQSVSDITAINEKQKEFLEEIGYGNLYSIELLETVKKRHKEISWLRTSEYNKICEAAKPFESLKSMIEAYHPDYIFVLSWSDKDDFFDDTDFQEKKEWFESNFRAVYDSKSYHTKVIWSVHPRRFSFLKTNLEDMCFYLANTYHQLESE